jgi:succinyl-CoA synthetase beta subunit
MAESDIAMKIVNSAKASSRSVLFEHESDAIARHFGIIVAKSGIARKTNEVIGIAKRIGFPLAMKVVSQDVIHKSDIGAVVLNIGSPSEARKSFSVILKNVKKAYPRARIEGVLLQKMARRGFEFVVGATRDAQFGPTVMFGLGGIYVELFKDVSFRLAPLSKKEAVSMMNETKASALFRGFRGSTPLDVNSGAETLVAVGKMMAEIDAIESIDMNPLFIYPKGSMAVDVRILLKKSV